MMNVPRIIVGLLLFVGSAWLVPLISTLLDVGEALVFSTIGSVMAFAGGMILYSGVRQCQRWY